MRQKRSRELPPCVAISGREQTARATKEMEIEREIGDEQEKRSALR